jgi:hypothetical protein
MKLLHPFCQKRVLNRIGMFARFGTAGNRRACQHTNPRSHPPAPCTSRSALVAFDQSARRATRVAVGLKVGQGANLHFTMGHRMFEGQLFGMQADPRGWGAPIKRVTENWKSFGRGMDSDLVCAAGHRLSLHQRPSFGGCHDSETGFRPLRPACNGRFKYLSPARTAPELTVNRER